MELLNINNTKKRMIEWKNFLYDITLDYYGVVDIDAANNQIDTTSRSYGVNKYFEDYWKILNEWIVTLQNTGCDISLFITEQG